MALVEGEYPSMAHSNGSTFVPLHESSRFNVEEDIPGSTHGVLNGNIPNVDELPLADIPRLEPSAGIKNIMVTGGNGFIGHWVLRSLGALYSNCYNVVSFDSLELGTSARNTESLKKLGNFAFFQGDITSSRDIEDCIRRHQIDTVIHLAAQSHVAGGSKDTAGCINSNVQGTFMLLDRANAAGVSRFLFMSSGQVYGSTEPPPFGFTENCPLAPANMYSGSKAAGEMLVMAFGYSTKMKTMIVRPCNVYGPNQFPEKVIPKFAMLLKRGRKLPLNGTEEHSRRYIFITDVVNAFNTVLHRGQSGKVYNLCSEEELSNRELCTHILHCVKPEVDGKVKIEAWIESTREKKPRDSGAMMNCSELKSLGWKPLVNMEDGLRKTVDWYMKHGESWWGSIDHVLNPP